MFLSTLRLISCAIMPAAIFVAVSAPELVPVLLGSRWHEVIGPLRISAMAAAVLCLDSPWTPMFLSCGLARAEFARTGVRTVMLGLTLFPLTLKFGASGSATAMLISIVSVTPTWFMGMRIVGIRASTLARTIAPGLLMAVLVAAATAIVRFGILRAIPSAASIVPLAAAAVTTAGILGTALFVCLRHRDLLSALAPKEEAA
jgi:O-antigen/teichoic acid export membrane protein